MDHEMDHEEEKGSSQPKPRYVWDPKKLAWVETTEAEEPATEEVAVEPKREEVSEEAAVEAKAEEVRGEAAVEGTPVEVPGEAVGPQYRGAWIRLVALIVDLIVLTVISYILARASGVQILKNTASGTVITQPSSWEQWLFFVIIFFYFVGLWTWRGQTPGKWLLGAKIVKTDGRPIGIGRALLRLIVYVLYLLVWALLGTRIIVLFLIGIIAFIVVALSKKKRGIHDLIAGTVVINSRPKKPAPVAVAEPVDAAEATETAEPASADEPKTNKTEQDK